MRFNIFKSRANVVRNYEGAKAYTLTPETELYSAVVTAGLNDNFYEKGDKRLERIRELMAKNDPAFVARLAIYARNQMYLRSVPQVLAVELAKLSSGSSIVSQTVRNVVKRADEITELLAYYQHANKREGTKKLNRLSKQVQKGLADAFNTFDEYQFAKYNQAREIKLRDALFLVHPKAKDEVQQALFNKIAADELATPYTWETELSALGQSKFSSNEARAEAFRAKWEELIDSRKIGYMAMLRNLRNILEANVSASHIQKVCDFLSDRQAVAHSRQLPFRFLAAFREVKATRSEFASMVLDALEKAVMVSADGIRGFDAKTSVLIACDVSGSMGAPISVKSAVRNFDIGLMLGMLMQLKCRRVVTGIFGDSWKVINVPRSNVLSNVGELYSHANSVGYSTNGYKVIDYLIDHRLVIDKVMMFTDCQMWNSVKTASEMESSWNAYKRIAPDAKLYLFDLAGYGNTPLDTRRGDVYLIGGWSDKIFDVLEAIEQGASAISRIKEIQL